MAKVTQNRSNVTLGSVSESALDKAALPEKTTSLEKTVVPPLDISPLDVGKVMSSVGIPVNAADTARVLQEELDREKRLFLRQNSRDFGELDSEKIWYNPCVASLYHHALRFEPHTVLTSTGALSCLSGEKTGRSPGDKRTVLDSDSRDKVWWESVNIPIESKSFQINKRMAIDYINNQDRIYVIDALAGWNDEHRIKVRVVSTRAYHALFMHNLLIVPDAKDLVNFVPDFTIYNAGPCEANTATPGVTSTTSICLNYGTMEMVILGTEYAGEMKKGVLTLMMYILPQKGLLPLHSSCNIGYDGTVTLFFGLSGTGKTTLSAEPTRKLIGDDEHVWTEDGIFNIEGGCYAKCKDLSKDHEPEIFDAIKFGAVLENVVYNLKTHKVDYSDISITENTRCAYPLEFITNSLIPATVTKHPNNIIFLTCDAFGALPPVSKLTVAQAMYHFVSGYTTKMAGTEIGITKPTATFSACYAGPFLAMHPMVYAKLLEKRLEQHNSDVWLVNTGWIKGPCDSPTGQRIPLKYTRKIIDAIHDGSLERVSYTQVPIFNLKVPVEIPGVPEDVLHQEIGWGNREAHHAQLVEVAAKFIKNFDLYRGKADARILGGEPVLRGNECMNGA